MNVCKVSGWNVRRILAKKLDGCYHSNTRGARVKAGHPLLGRRVAIGQDNFETLEKDFENEASFIAR